MNAYTCWIFGVLIIDSAVKLKTHETRKPSKILVYVIKFMNMQINNHKVLIELTPTLGNSFVLYVARESISQSSEVDTLVSMQSTNSIGGLFNHNKLLGLYN